ncbi:S8 family serine peptidase [Lysobacter korlensis]|uniref:S8 family serine peptidase n=1 Tax=Lysobacter korlensis TaxID=553636 RepID=A0ABV6RKA5_9GAMM
MRPNRLMLLGCLSTLLVAHAAGAQALGGRPGLPALPTGVPSLPTQAATAALDRTLSDPRMQAPLAQLRRLQIRDLVRTHRARVDLDLQGEPVLRGEFLMLGAAPDAIDALRAAGFELAPGAATDNALDLDIAVVRDTRGRRATRAMRDLQRAAPEATFAFQHIYLQAAPVAAATVAATGASAVSGAVRIGLIDGGVDAAHPALAGVRIKRHGCGGAAKPQPHGTAVATRLAARGTELYAADLWCGDPVGQATLGLVQALAWMSRERVPVVNISLVGPDNPVLARAVQSMLARGHVLVAAVGNDGPAAPPLFPAAYAGVIAVSGVDAKQRVLPESGSGPHVDFSATGVLGEGPRAMRGTSFAAPVVARLAAESLSAPDPAAATHVQRALAARARDLGKPGRDPRYGDGLIDPLR